MTLARFALVATLAVPCAALQSQEPNPEALYIQKGCLGCHGASARGGVGPTLAGTALELPAFLAQLRQPRGIMPAFPPEAVSDAEAEQILGYVKGVPAAPPRIRADLPAGVLDSAGCVGCHQRLNPMIVQQFTHSAMGQPGTQNARVAYARIRDDRIVYELGESR